MSYITKEHARSALSKMQNFYEDLVHVHQKNGISFTDDLCRRNAVISKMQEKAFAESLSETYGEVQSLGKTGEPDIIVPSLNKELECKLTTPRKSGGVMFQTDYLTLKKKGTLDHLYVVANREFDKFLVLFYESLSIDDFSSPTRSSRGRVKLIKHRAADRCHVVWGKVEILNNARLKKLQNELTMVSKAAIKKKERIHQSIDYWKTAPHHYAYTLEGTFDDR